MTMPEEVASFLARHTRAFLLTRRRDGAPTIHPMTGFFADGRVVMTTYRKSAKARNVERDPRAAALLVNGYGRDDVRAVCVQGRAALRRADVDELPTAERTTPKVASGVAERVRARMASGKRVRLELEAGRAAFVQRLWSD
jgi:hypothetical protein